MDRLSVPGRMSRMQPLTHQAVAHSYTEEQCGGFTSTEPQAATSITPSPNEPTNHAYTTDQILTCTVSECWQLAGRDEDKLFDIIQQLAVLLPIIVI